MFKFEILDDDNTDERGILKDRHIMRTSMMARDSLSDVQKAIAATRDATQYGAATFDASLRKPGYVRTTDAARDARNAARDAMYSDYDKSVSTAWERKPPPVGAYSSNTSNVGDPCMCDNHSPGTLQEIDGSPGWLRCVGKDSRDNTGDSMPLTRTQVSAADAAAIKERAYASYDSNLVHAWRNK